MNHVLGQVRVIRVPDQTDGDDLGTVEEDTGHPELLPTLTLRTRTVKRKSTESRGPTTSHRSRTVEVFTSEKL